MYLTDGLSSSTDSIFESGIFGIFSAFVGGIVVFLVIGLIISIFMLVCMGLILKKNGKPGWYAIIPILNVWSFFEIADIKGWWCLVPFANIVYAFIAEYRICIKMGHGAGLFVVVLLLPIIGFPILAFSKTPENLNNTNMNQNGYNPNMNTAMPQQPTFVNNNMNNGMAQPMPQQPTFVNNDMNSGMPQDNNTNNMNM